MLHNSPLLVFQDVWWPVADAPNAWVSVGNYDPAVRLGHRHEKLGGSATPFSSVLWFSVVSTAFCCALTCLY
jgi:hypothetical protein